MAHRTTTAEKLFAFSNSLLLLVVVAVTLYPFWHSVMASISDPYQMISHQGALPLPLGLSFSAYRSVLSNPNILSGYANTLINVVIGVAINMVLTTFGAYGLSRRGLFWGKPIMFFVVFTMFFSGGLIPLYLTVSALGLLNSRFSILLPLGLSTWNLIVMRTYFLTIPESMEEAAALEGAHDFAILARVMIPLAIPIVAVMVLFYTVTQWNAWFYAMIFINKRDLYPLQLILREILIINSTDSMVTAATVGDKEPLSETIRSATIIVATLPILAVYPFLQRYFVKGIMIGAIKE